MFLDLDVKQNGRCWGGGGGGDMKQGGECNCGGAGGGTGGHYRDIMGFRGNRVVNVVEFPYTTNSDVQIYVIRK